MTPQDDSVLPLEQALALARQQLQAQQPPQELPAQIRARVQAARPSRRAATLGSRWAWPAVAALALLLVGSVVLTISLPPGHPEGAPQANGGERMAGFMPLVPQEDWPAGDAAAWLVNTELRRDRLVALGLPFDPSGAGDSVRAELLVRPSGEVLAVRFLQ